MIIIPVGVDYKAERYPVVTFTLIGLNVVVFAGQLAAFASGGGAELYQTFGLVPADHGIWAWFTSIFMHGGLFHLLGNMVYLFLFGACVEDLMGRGKFVAFYLMGGLMANIIQVIFSTSLTEHIPIIGASGATSACIGAFLVMLPKTEIQFRYLVLTFYSGEFWIRSWIVIVIWFLLDLLSMVVELSSASGSGGGVAFGAHVGGTIAGALMMMALRKSSGRSVVQRAPAAIILEDPPGTPPVYLSVDGNQTGPFPPSSVRSMLQLGAISAGNTYFWREDMPDWRPVSEL
jgi:membrane associated rhomboid family serine protease